MPDPFVQLLTRAKAWEKAVGNGGPLAALTDYFGAADAALKSLVAHRRVATRIKPDVVAVLHAAWDRSGLDKNSKAGHGKMYHAATDGAVIDASETGIRISLPAGQKKEFYAWAGALLYGAVHGPVEQREIRDTITGRFNGSRKGSVLGDKAKRSIKRAALTGTELSKRSRQRITTDSMLRNGAQEHAYVQRRAVNLGSVRVDRPHDFWLFTDTERAGLVAKYLDYLVEEVNALLQGHKAMRAKVKALAS